MACVVFRKYMLQNDERRFWQNVIVVASAQQDNQQTRV